MLLSSAGEGNGGDARETVPDQRAFFLAWFLVVNRLAQQYSVSVRRQRFISAIRLLRIDAHALPFLLCQVDCQSAFLSVFPTSNPVYVFLLPP